MGIWRFAGAFAVVKRQGECGSKTAGIHVSQPVPIGVCYLLALVVKNLFPIFFRFCFLLFERLVVSILPVFS